MFKLVLDVKEKFWVMTPLRKYTEKICVVDRVGHITFFKFAGTGFAWHNKAPSAPGAPHPRNVDWTQI